MSEVEVFLFLHLAYSNKILHQNSQHRNIQNNITLRKTPGTSNVVSACSNSGLCVETVTFNLKEPKSFFFTFVVWF